MEGESTEIRDRLRGTVNMTPSSFCANPWVIWPHYTRRDKGALRGTNSKGQSGLMTFFSPGYAWKHIFDVVQPNDIRACTNYEVIRLSEYRRDS